MAAYSPAEGVAVGLATATCSSDTEFGPSQQHVGRPFTAMARSSAFHVVMILVAIPSFVAIMWARPTKSHTSGASNKSFLGLSGDDGEDHLKHTYSYGLKACPCPLNTSVRSGEGLVSIADVKTALGAMEGDTVKFWWVYPAAAYDLKDEALSDPEIQQLQAWGGFQYAWGNNTKCMSFLPIGDNFTLADSDFVPEVDEKDWHKVTIPKSMELFSWVAPTNKKGECEAGCFTYKEGKSGQATALEVVSIQDTAGSMVGQFK